MRLAEHDKHIFHNSQAKLVNACPPQTPGAISRPLARLAQNKSDIEGIMRHHSFVFLVFIALNTHVIVAPRQRFDAGKRN